ncbi:hypothetical protein Tcan_00296, partial [Toxocara canis]
MLPRKIKASLVQCKIQRCTKTVRCQRRNRAILGGSCRSESASKMRSPEESCVGCSIVGRPVIRGRSGLLRFVYCSLQPANDGLPSLTMRPALITISTVLLGGVLAHFSEDFSKFLDEKYGEEVRNALEGNHLKNVSEMLSFGGKVFANEVITKTPVIFVHGVAATANVFAKHREYFI